jgi:hypothetical protein
MLYPGDERHAGRHTLSDYRLKVRIVRRTHTRATAERDYGAKDEINQVGSSGCMNELPGHQGIGNEDYEVEGISRETPPESHVDQFGFALTAA